VNEQTRRKKIEMQERHGRISKAVPGPSTVQLRRSGLPRLVTGIAQGARMWTTDVHECTLPLSDHHCSRHLQEGVRRAAVERKGFCSDISMVRFQLHISERPSGGWDEKQCSSLFTRVLGMRWPC
jgi:hypothetical protein